MIVTHTQLADAASDESGDPVTTFFFQSGRDLVAARTNSDGAFVIEALLCEDQPGYYECTKRYKYGLFDSRTGQKLKLDLTRANGGTWIDPETFQVVDPPEEHSMNDR